jgi:hypothetical protein
MLIKESKGTPNIIREFINNKFDNLELNKYSLVRYFRDVFYASLPHEIRSNLSSLEVFILSLETKDKVSIEKELKNTSEWSRYEALNSFNHMVYILMILLIVMIYLLH